MQELSSIISANLRRRRKSLPMTQAELAEALGYSEKAISKWESGKGLPPTAILLRLATVLKTTPTALLTAETNARLYLGIDGGGTKTEFVLANAAGLTETAAPISAAELATIFDWSKISGKEIVVSELDKLY